MTKQKNTMTKEGLDRFIEELDALPVKEQTDFSAREIVERLKAKLQHAMDEKGYTIRDVVVLLEKHGAKVSPSTLTAYLRAAGKAKSKTPKHRKAASPVQKPNSVQTSIGQKLDEPQNVKAEPEQTDALVKLMASLDDDDG